MFRRFTTNFAIFSIFLDVICVVIGLYLASYLRPFLNVFPYFQIITQSEPLPWIVYLLFATIWVAILINFSVYDGRRNLYLSEELARLTMGSALAAIALAGTLYISYRDISRALFLTFVLITYSILLIWRMVVFLANRYRDEDTKQRRVLIIGAGPVGRDLTKQLSQHAHLKIKPIGFLDDNPEKLTIHRDVLGPLEAARTVVEKHEINDVIIALPRRAYDKVNRLVAELHTLPVKVWVIPDYFHLALHKASIEEFAGIPMLDLRAPALNEYQRMIKRSFDLIITISTLPFSLILIGLITIGIRLGGKGPVIIRQSRVGENGRLFAMLKFRTMIPDAERFQQLVETYDSEGNLIHKIPSDPRVTRFGRFLRRTSLDELPQIINILKGDMSLVGPRPEMPYLVEKYEPWQHKRFAVPQGLTGWWQVNGRSDRPMHLHTEDDLFYVQNYSLFLDVIILLKTFFVVLRGRGAF